MSENGAILCLTYIYIHTHVQTIQITHYTHTNITNHTRITIVANIYELGCVNISISAGSSEVFPGMEAVDWKADSSVQPCWVKRFRTVVWVWGVSINLKVRGGGGGGQSQ